MKYTTFKVESYDKKYSRTHAKEKLLRNLFDDEGLREGLADFETNQQLG